MARTTRSTRSKLFTACDGLLIRAFFNTSSSSSGAGGSSSSSSAAPATSSSSSSSAAAAGALTLTQEELNARIAQAVKDADDRRAQADADAKKQKEIDDKKKAGEYQALYEAEQAAAKAQREENTRLKLDLRKTQVGQRLRDYVGRDHKEYAAVAGEYMVPLLKIETADLSDAEADKQIKAIVDKYVKDNPRASKGTPPIPGRTGKAAAAKSGEEHESTVSVGVEQFPSYFEG